MRRVPRILLVILSYMPIATVAVAAQAKASEMYGEAQTMKMRTALQAARSRLLPSGATSATLDDAFARYANVTGLQGQELQDKFNEDMRLLQYSGLIHMDEKMLKCGGPSEHY